MISKVALKSDRPFCMKFFFSYDILSSLLDKDYFHSGYYDYCLPKGFLWTMKIKYRILF